MKLKSIISKTLVMGLLFNNGLTSLAGVLSEDGRYEAFEGSSIAIDNILEEDKVDIEIEGNTLVSPMKNVSYSGYSKVAMKKMEDGRIVNDSTSGVSSNNNYYMMDTDSKEYLRLKKDTTYTIFISGIIDFVESNLNRFVVPFYRNLNDGVPVTRAIETIKVSQDTYFNETIVFTTNNQDMESFGFYISNASSIVNNVDMYFHVVEGDYSHLNLDYFEGLKSGFENQLITQEIVDSGLEKTENLGKYKVEVKTTGKNKINLDDVLKELYIDNNHSKELGNYKESIIYKNLDISNLKGKYRLSGTFELNDVEHNLVVLLHNIENIKNIHNESFTYLVSSGDGIQLDSSCILDLTDYKYMTITTGNIKVVDIGSYSINIKNIQLEEGSIATDYEPYKESINTLYLNSPLLEGDTIEYVSGQAYHVKRANQVTFSGTESWFDYGGPYYDENDSYFGAYTTLSTLAVNDTGICDKFIQSGGAVYYRSREGVWVCNNNMYIMINKSKLQTVDLTGFKKWLKDNHITLVYKLAEPIYEPIKTDLSVQLFEGTTYISNNSNIPANMTITVDRTINRAVEAIELFNVTPTTENLSKARMWVNLLDESIKKDELQSEINSITGLEDMVLERKSATANLDVYVMCENMLSMSLNTNNITFDNYSGVEDMEKLNALEISINSSLPYDLNAYLQTEINGSENSNIMDMDILKIKDSSKDNYQSFTNTTDKVVLDEDCASGNYISHNIDLKLESSNAYSVDVYKTTIKFEAVQK